MPLKPYYIKKRKIMHSSTVTVASQIVTITEGGASIEIVGPSSYPDDYTVSVNGKNLSWNGHYFLFEDPDTGYSYTLEFSKELKTFSSLTVYDPSAETDVPGDYNLIITIKTDTVDPIFATAVNKAVSSTSGTLYREIDMEISSGYFSASGIDINGNTVSTLSLKDVLNILLSQSVYVSITSGSNQYYGGAYLIHAEENLYDFFIYAYIGSTLSISKLEIEPSYERATIQSIGTISIT